jgi:hypothetical protein
LGEWAGGMVFLTAYIQRVEFGLAAKFDLTPFVPTFSLRLSPRSISEFLELETIFSVLLEFG